MRIRVTGDKRVNVSAPDRLPEKRIAAFVAEHESYIKERLESVERQRSRCYPRSYMSGDTFCMLGQRFTLRVMNEAKAFSGLAGFV